MRIICRETHLKKNQLTFSENLYKEIRYASFFFLLGLGIICHFCKRNSLPQYQATMPDGKLYNFCNSSCVAKFQVCYFPPLPIKCI